MAAVIFFIIFFIVGLIHIPLSHERGAEVGMARSSSVLDVREWRGLCYSFPMTLCRLYHFSWLGNVLSFTLALL